MTAVAMIRRVLGIPVALVVALLLQLVLVNRLPLPGGGAPDLVLLVVAAAGATAGPLAGTIAGFCGGLALDIAPPGGHLAGEYALVFCLAGYACGRLRMLSDVTEDYSSVMSLAVVAIGAAGGEVAKAGLGRMLSDPEMTVPVIKHVLPGAILYDLLLSPFVLWLIAALVRQRAPERMPDPHQRRVRTAPEYGALRLAGAGAAPRLRLGGGSLAAPQAPRHREPRLRLGGGTPAAPGPTRRKEPKLRLAGANFSRTTAVNSPVTRRPVSVNFATTGRGGPPGGSVLGPGQSRGSRLNGSGLKGSALRGSGLKGSALRGSGLNGSGLNGPGRKESALRGSGPQKGWLRAGKNLGNGFAPRKSPGKGWLKSGTPALAKFSGSALSARPSEPKFRRRGPSRGWLGTARSAPATPKFRSPGRRWLKPGKPASSSWSARKSPGRGWMKSGGTWRKSGKRGKGMGGLR